MFSGWRHLSQHLLAYLPSLMPASCALCGGTAPAALCDGCERQFFRQASARCRRCAAPLPKLEQRHASPLLACDDQCGNCLKTAPAFDATVVAAEYAAPIDQLVLALKFGSRLALAPLFARMLRDALLQTQSTPSHQLALPSLLTAVPLGADRLVERGFNQALEIAKPLSRSLGIRLDPHLAARARDTHAQALLHPDARRKNMRNAFIVAPAAIARLHGQHVGVVDDVITTGETLHAFAATLKRYGAARVTNLVFARTVQK